MITRENTIKLCSRGNSEALTTKEIIELGFDKHDLPKLIENGYLSKIKKGYYKISDNLLKEYIGLLWSYNLKEESIVYLEKLYTNSKDSREVILKLFQVYVEVGDLTNIIKYYKELVRVSKTDKEIADSILYLKIMSYYLPLPDELREKAEFIKPKKTFIKGENKKVENNLRDHLANGGYVSKEDLDTINDDIIDSLLTSKYCNKKFINATILNAIECKKYHKIVNILNLLKRNRALNYEEIIMLKLAQKLQYLQQCPLKSFEPREKLLFHYIEANCFEDALNLRAINNPVIESLLKECIALSRKWHPSNFDTYFLETKEKLLKEKGAIILEYLTDYEKEQLKAIVANEPSITIFSITDFGRELIILAYANPENTDIYENLLNEKTILTESKDSESYLEACKNTLSSNPEDFMNYLKLATAYEALEDDELAFTYYTIAYSLADTEENDKYSIKTLKKQTKKRLYEKSRQKNKVLTK